MSETAQDAFKRLLREVVAPALRQNGLRGSGGIYVVPNPMHWALVGFQKSKWCTSEIVEFTINLKVTSKELWDEERREHSYLKDTPPPGVDAAAWSARRLEQSYYAVRPSANTVDAGVLLRIGHLIPAAAGDYWWSLTVENARDIVDDALQAVVEYGLPWLRREVNVKANAEEPPIR